ncbi:alpha/beta hydrolase-fold protein [Flavisolibacter tropicus]|uniref:Phospholipase n=1 Tax=Flavisolibacter tropicus TaxID=1492898 RepID=A0A172TQU0_9BACT|nr:prolyl oligopeptidase family serine peptidase [Flavisolibacter tropicus]ANE49449.1 phospholipase [Flavisolibacter tropicus]
MMKFFFYCILSLFTGLQLQAQDFSLYQKKWFIANNDTLPYRILLPKDFQPTKKYPLVLVLHGSGERGSDNEKQLSHGANLFLNDTVRQDFPAIVVFPQCSENSYWSNVKITTDSAGKRTFNFQTDGEPTTAMHLLQRLVTSLTDNYPIDRKRMYVGGLSMGGMGTFELVRRNPKTYAAAFPICGGANPETANKLHKTAWWIFHGAKDDIVSPTFSEQMVDALKKHKAEVLFRLYPDANHNSWDSAFAEKDLLPWLFSHYK